MDDHAWTRAEPQAAAGLAAAAVVLFVVVGATGGSLKAAALAALIALAIGAVLALDALRRFAARAADAELALAASHVDAARARTGQAAAEAQLRQAAQAAEEREAGSAQRDREREALREQAEHEAEEHRAERDRLREALHRAERAGARQRELMGRLEQSRRAEREWNRELRGQLDRLYQSRARPFHHGDVRALILEAAMQLVEAQKGMLLSREDADGDGALDVVLSAGFEHDPQDSFVAQRFAREVLALDEIVRDDTPSDQVDRHTAADEEIDALVAIPLYVRDRFSGVIVCANRAGGFEEVDDDVLLALGDHAGAALHQGQLRNEIREAHVAAIRALLEAMAARHPQLHRESTRLAVHALTLARELGLDDGQRDVLICATLLSNIGYLTLPEALLAEPGPLRPDQRAVMELHPRLGFNVIGHMPALREVATTVLYHHERFDGGGYPAGLAGDSIPRAARALAVLEAYSAMTCDRSYRSARTPEEACVELVAAAGTQFDPEITQLFVEEIRRGTADVGDPLADAVVDALPLDLLGEPGAIVGPLAAASTDGLTLLGNQRALARDLREAAAAAPDDARFALALVQLSELARVNAELAPEAGDRMIQLAARNAQRTAARFGATAYRTSGRRLAILARLSDRHPVADLLDDLRTEFTGGPSVQTAACVLEPGEAPAEALDRARGALGVADAAPPRAGRD